MASTSNVVATTVSNTTELASSSGLPFARSIPVVLEVTGMKPFTTLHGFIDGRNIDLNIYPTAQLVISNEVGTFLGYKDISPSNNYSPIRGMDTSDFQGNLQSLYPDGKWTHSNIFGKGEVIRYYVNSTTFTAAIVLSREIQLDPVTRTNNTVLHVALMRQYLTTSAYTDNIIPYSWGTTWNSPVFPNAVTIKGDSSGATATIVSSTVPSIGAINTNSLGNFYGVYIIPGGDVLVGSHNISFTDSITNDLSAAQTSTASKFTSLGELDVSTNTIVNRNDTYVNTTSTQEIITTSYADPLAETFMIPGSKKDGCFVTSVDLYFAAKSLTETQPVNVQIVETLNGYPTQNVIFNAIAQLSPDKITTSTDASVATRFRFKGLVFLKPSVEYALKVLSNSTSYRVYISQIGEINLSDPTKAVVQQPYLGVLFKSQNNSAWTPDQLQDLMFQINYAKFNTSVSGLITVQNQSNAIAPALLPSNPFSVANGSTTVKVFFPSHGLFVGGYLDFTGSNATIFNARYIVTTVIDPDRFTITVGTAQTFSGLTGGVAVKATKNIKYDTLVLDLGQDYSLTKGTGLTTTAAQSSSSAKETVSTSYDWNVNNDLPASRWIMSDTNESIFLSGKKSIDVNMNIFSSSSDLSPIINRNDINAFLISNKINNPTSADNTIVDNRTIISALAGVTLTATTNIMTIPTTVDISMFREGSFITLSGTVSNNITAKIIDKDVTTSPYILYLGSALVTESPAATTIVQASGFIDEISSVYGTALSKYITNSITLDSQATAIQIMFSAVIPSAADIKLYYRTGISTSNVALADSKWVLVNTPYKKSQGKEFIDQQYLISALPGFNTAQIKIVHITTDTTQVPLIKDLRVICLA